MRILWLLIFAHVNTISNTARGKMVHGVGQRLSIRIRREQRQSFGKSPLDLHLQRIVIRDPEILEDLNIAL
jgi:hypothetical protein